MPFEKDVDSLTFGQVARMRQPFIAVGEVCTCNAFKFFGMWGQYHALWQLLQPRPVVGQHIEPVSINHHRNICISHLCDQGNGRCFIMP